MRLVGSPAPRPPCSWYVFNFHLIFTNAGFGSVLVKGSAASQWTGSLNGWFQRVPKTVPQSLGTHPDQTEQVQLN